MATRTTHLFIAAAAQFFSTACFAQMSAIDRYMNTDDIRTARDMVPAARTQLVVRSSLPLANSTKFAEYVSERTSLVDEATLRAAIENLRLNKLVGNTAGASGTTSLVSKVAVPAVLGFATEYGSILQSNNGTTSTLRGNLLGITRMALGSTQFPICTVADPDNCPSHAQWLRRFSGSISFGNVSSAKSTGTAVATGTATPVVTDLFGSDYRMSSWGLRFDLTRNDPDDPKYVAAWRSAMTTLRGSAAPGELATAITTVFTDPVTRAPSTVYISWQAQTVPLLIAAPDAAAYKRILEEQLELLIVKMTLADSKFAANIAALRKGILNYVGVRDDLLQQIQRHKMSLEYTNQHNPNQPTTSNLRFVYSHQPSTSPTLLTFNGAFTWYNNVPNGSTTGRFRDFQLAGQLDRRLGEIPNLGNAVLTVGAYYQWMKEDAQIIIGPGNVAPGSGIVLPGTAATLLGTKGHIGIVQGKLAIPINSVVRIPISVTWSNRTELINEKDLRGQVGLTLDLDSVFHK